MNTRHWIVAGLSVVALAACEDPAKGKAKAVTTEATPSAAETKLGTTEGTKYTFDQTTSKIEWTGSKLTGRHEGGFKTFTGAISLVDLAPERSSVTVDIDTDSLFADADKLLGHLKSADFFDVSAFPKASFVSTAVSKGGETGGTHTVTGNLTLHGVTKRIGFPATIKTNPGGVDVDAEFAINRKDFGLVYPGKPDDLIRDDVVIRITIRSRTRCRRLRPRMPRAARGRRRWRASSMRGPRTPRARRRFRAWRRPALHRTRGS